MSNYTCDSNSIVNTISNSISKLEKNIKHNPSRKNDLILLRKALDNYKTECGICKGKASSDVMCLNAALNNLYRQLPFIRNSVYPWLNYEWDYGNFIDNNFSARRTGSSTSGEKYFNNLKIFFKLFNAYMLAANPNRYSNAGGTNSNSDYPRYGCIGNKRNACKTRNQIRNRNPQKKPYSSHFFNKKLKGEYSSSYFIKVGSCPRPDITDINKCVQRNYEWKNSLLAGGKSNGSCHMPRYAYLNNKPGLNIKIPGINQSIKVRGAKGYIPSLANDILSLTPDKLFNAFRGRNVDGHMIVQQCPDIKESFNIVQSKKILFEQILVATTIIVVFVLLLVLHSKFKI